MVSAYILPLNILDESPHVHFDDISSTLRPIDSLRDKTNEIRYAHRRGSVFYVAAEEIRCVFDDI